VFTFPKLGNQNLSYKVNQENNKIKSSSIPALTLCLTNTTYKQQPLLNKTWQEHNHYLYLTMDLGYTCFHKPASLWSCLYKPPRS